MGQIYLCIDLKSFYASVECVERNLNPLTTNLVVADESRTQKTICLAVSPSLKSLGIPGRPRLFEVVQKINQINKERCVNLACSTFTGESYNSEEIKNNQFTKIGYIIAPPQMAKYIKISSEIYEIYLKYIAPEDIHVYSIDEVFIDLTPYQNIYNLTPKQIATKIINDVLNQTGITATAGIGTNMYLAKIAMDIEAKHVTANKDGVRIAELNEMSFRKKLWSHEPLSDFWRIGHGLQKRLHNLGLFTMGDIARFSLKNEHILYKVFGVNAELIIDHAWGYEPCTMKEVKSYKSENHSMSEGQVLQHAYNFEDAKIVAKEMAENLTFMLFEKNLLTNQIGLTVSYDIDNLTKNTNQFVGELVIDGYGRKMPKPVHGGFNFPNYTNSVEKIMEATVLIFDKIVEKNLLIRRINITANNILAKDEYTKINLQLDLFEEIDESKKIEQVKLKIETNRNKALLEIKNRFGKNSILRGIDLTENATTKMRNEQIGGHKA